MTPLRKARWFSTAITLVAACAWVLASNHCAFAAMKGAVEAESGCCHKAAPTKPLPSTQCCEAFNVPIPDHASAPVAQFHELTPAWIATVTMIAPQPSVISVASDNGPPRAQGVLRMVFARCVPAHAPPDFVA